ncbi:hypothetical protein M8J75_006922 [Diaphorina citri]|nr:hypothetical protein M8J75_006922 [Diaphorina citri]
MSALQPNSRGSATGNPRNKTALKPGHSLMDWIRLGNSGVNLSGIQGRILVSKAQLAEHNKEDDMWMCIRGVVYNVTRYMDFHPGGREELMRGAGMDATELFNKVHPWVNYESILQKCIVGKMGSSLPDENPFVIPSKKSSEPKPLPSINVPVKPFENEKASSNNVSKSFYSMDWFQQLNFICFVFYLKSSCPKVLITLNENNTDLSLLINERSLLLHLEQPVKWPCQVKINLNVGKLQLQLNKEEAKLWKHHSTKTSTNNITSNSTSSVNIPVSKFNTMRLLHQEQVTHNVVLITLEYTSPMFFYVPVGHHVFIKFIVNDVDISKPYTPVEPLQAAPLSYSNTLTFLIKSYEDGLLSPLLCGLREGQELEVSSPEGKFDVGLIGKRNKLVLLAAGTGLTPMIPVINWSIQSQRQSVQLVFFNRTEQDIIWRDQLDTFASKNSKLSVDHVLSEPSSSWEGPCGRISLDLLHKYVPTRSSDIPADVFICVCGPIGFNQTTEQYLSELNYSQEDYFSFAG